MYLRDLWWPLLVLLDLENLLYSLHYLETWLELVVMPTSKVRLIPKKAQFSLDGIFFFFLKRSSFFFKEKLPMCHNKLGCKMPHWKITFFLVETSRRTCMKRYIIIFLFFSNCVYIVWPLTFFEKASINQHLIKASFRTFSIANFSLDKKVCVQKTLRISFFSLWSSMINNVTFWRNNQYGK